MKERPILFSGEMVRAILEGRKTQTRRIISKRVKQPDCWMTSTPSDFATVEMIKNNWPCKYGKVGDRLWVRETFGVMPGTLDEEKQFVYRADCPLDIQGWPARRGAIEDFIRWRPSIHMPRIACRINLEITNIRVERVHDISAKDTLAEGVDNGMSNPTMGKRWENMQHIAFVDLWEKISGEGSWAANPFVWVLEFKKI